MVDLTYQTVDRELCLLLIRLAVLLRVLYSHIDEMCVLRLVGGGEEKRRVSRSILLKDTVSYDLRTPQDLFPYLRLVDVDRCSTRQYASS